MLTNYKNKLSEIKIVIVTDNSVVDEGVWRWRRVWGDT